MDKIIKRVAENMIRNRHNISDEDVQLSGIQTQVFAMVLTKIEDIVNGLKTKNFTEIEKEYESALKLYSAHDDFMEKWNKKYDVLHESAKSLSTELKKYPPYEVMPLEDLIEKLLQRKKELEEEIKLDSEKAIICGDILLQYNKNNKKDDADFYYKLPSKFKRIFPDFNRIKGDTEKEKVENLVFPFYYKLNGVDGTFFKDLSKKEKNLKNIEKSLKEAEKTYESYKKINDRNDSIQEQLDKIDDEMNALIKERDSQPKKLRSDYAKNHLSKLKTELDSYPKSNRGTMEKLKDIVEKIYLKYAGKNDGPIMKHLSKHLKAVTNGAWYNRANSDLSYADRCRLLDNLCSNIGKINLRGIKYQDWISDASLSDSVLINSVEGTIAKILSSSLSFATKDAFTSAIRNVRNKEVGAIDDEEFDDGSLEARADDKPETYMDDLVSDNWKAIKSDCLSDLNILVTRCMKYWKGDINHMGSGYPSGNGKFVKSALSGWIPSTMSVEEIDGNLKSKGKFKIDTKEEGSYLSVNKLSARWEKILKSVIKFYDNIDFLDSGARLTLSNKVKRLLKSTGNLDIQAKAVVLQVDLFICEKIIISFTSKKMKVKNSDLVLERLNNDSNSMMLFGKIKKRIENELKSL